jgi:hypothetical protein
VAANESDNFGHVRIIAVSQATAFLHEDFHNPAAACMTNALTKRSVRSLPADALAVIGTQPLPHFLGGHVHGRREIADYAFSI